MSEKYNIYTYIDNKWVKVNKDIETYTKTETDVLLAAKAETNGVYTKDEINTLLESKANQSTSYTKTEVDALINASFNPETYYTKTNINDLLNLKADSSTVETLNTQVNTNTTDISTLQSEKADKSTTYTKTEVNTAITNAIGNIELYNIVESLPETEIQNNKIYLVPNTKNANQNKYDLYIHVGENWEKIDSIELDIASFASATDLLQAQSDIENLESQKADKNTIYTKTETDNAISTAVEGHTIVEVVNKLPESENARKLYLVPVSEE